MKGRRLVAAVLSLLAAACSAGQASPVPVRHLDSRLAVSSSAFGIRLADLLMNGGNLVLSPLSATLALSMAASGAGGDTRTAMLTTLGLEPGSDPGLLAKALVAELTATEGGNSQLEIANAVWTQKSYPPPTAAYRDQLRTDYQAKLGTLDFRSPAARQTVNDWASTATHRRSRPCSITSTPTPSRCSSTPPISTATGRPSSTPA